MNAHKGWVTGVASIGDDLLATCGRDAAVRLWDAQLRPAARAAAAPHAAHALASHPDPQLMTIYTAGKLVLRLIVCILRKWRSSSPYCRTQLFGNTPKAANGVERF